MPLGIIYNCPMCGYDISEDLKIISWANQFRGLVLSTAGSSISLTGVGCYPAPYTGDFFAPPDSRVRWDDAEYEPMLEHRFGAMDAYEVNGKRGFIIHADCWTLLEHACRPSPVALDRLFGILDSIPVVRNHTLNWGHDYGGLSLRRGRGVGYFPWEDCLVVHRDRDGGTPPLTYTSPVVSVNLQRVLEEPPTPPPSRKGLLSHPTGPAALPGCPPPGRDPFGGLPAEICLAIADFLSIVDMLNARLASRAFWIVYDCQHFWASRFLGADSERGWLFEAEQELQDRAAILRRDWRWLYHRTADARLGDVGWNRRRVWRLVRPLVDLLEFAWNVLPSELPLPWERPVLLVGSSPGPAWTLVCANLEGYDCDLSPVKDGRVKRSRIEQVRVPVGGIARIAAQTVRIGGMVYIAGLALTAADTGHVLRVGYSRAVGGIEQEVELEGSALRGFNVAVGVGGIQALQCVTDAGLSAWIGCPDDSPKTKRLSNVVADGQQTLVLEFRFDGIRFVSLAVERQPPAPVGIDSRNGNGEGSNGNGEGSNGNDEGSNGDDEGSDGNGEVIDSDSEGIEDSNDEVIDSDSEGIEDSNDAVAQQPPAPEGSGGDSEGSDDSNDAIAPQTPALRILGNSEDSDSNHNNAKFHHTALWYPDAPPPGLNLNLSLVDERDLYMEGFRPLFWTYFGGPGGCYLSDLVKITIRKASGRMDFSFASPGVPEECRSFGRLGPASLEDWDTPSEFHIDRDTLEFYIGGPGGEVLTKLEMLIEATPQYDPAFAMVWFKMHTNRGRRFEVGKATRNAYAEYITREFVAAPGTAITGFYGAVDRDLEHFNLVLLGVMTEPVEGMVAGEGER